MARLRPFTIALAALAALLAAALATGGPGQAKDSGERTEVEVAGVCGTSSSVRLRLRAESKGIRVDTRLRTSKRGVWRVSVFHERRLAARAHVRSTRGGRGFEYRMFLPDLEGPDAVRMRAVAPSGETCAAVATLSGSSERARS